MRVLITGATGFVGAHLRHHILASTDWDIVGTAFPSFPENPQLNSRERLIRLDMRDAEATKAALAETSPDYVIHLAAQSHVPTAYKNPWATLQNNILGQLNLLESYLALDLAPRTIVIGSGEEYGRADAVDLPLVEEHPLRPENPYSVSKVTQDVMGYQYFVSYGLPIMRVRPFNHVGPGQSPRFVLPAFASQVAEIEAGRRAPLLRVGNLAPERDFTDVRDVVRAYLLLLQQGTPGDVYNVASGHPCAIQSIVDELRARSTSEIKIEVDPDRYRPSDIPVIYGSAEKLTRDTGWVAEIPMSKTIDDVLAEWRASSKGDNIL